MISLIIGHKGSGKTKQLIACVNQAVEQSNGHVICVEKQRLLTFDVDYRARLVETDAFQVSGYDAFFGFLCGICAGDNDITDIMIDATLRIGGRDYNDLAAFLCNISKVESMQDINIVFTISSDKEELPAEIFDVCKVL